MKRSLQLIFIVLVLLLTSACSVYTRQDKALRSVGEYECMGFWTHGGFQDYTDFGIYVYSSASCNRNQYFTAVSEDDIEIIGLFVDNFDNWIDTFQNGNPADELVVNYAFDRSIMDTDDYFYIYEGEGYSKFGCYDLYLFDSQTNVLYYFHNNI